MRTTLEPPASGDADTATPQTPRSADDEAAITTKEPDDLGEPGPPLNHRAPFFVGLVGGIGFALAWWLFGLFEQIGSTLVLIIVAFFIAAGLNPVVLFLERRGCGAASR